MSGLHVEMLDDISWIVRAMESSELDIEANYVLTTSLVGWNDERPDNDQSRVYMLDHFTTVSVSGFLDRDPNHYLWSIFIMPFLALSPVPDF